MRPTSVPVQILGHPGWYSIIHPEDAEPTPPVVRSRAENWKGMGEYRGGYHDFDVGDASKDLSRNATEKKIAKVYSGRCSGCRRVTPGLTFPRLLSTSRL